MSCIGLVKSMVDTILYISFYPQRMEREAGKRKRRVCVEIEATIKQNPGFGDERQATQKDGMK